MSFCTLRCHFVLIYKDFRFYFALFLLFCIHCSVSFALFVMQSYTRNLYAEKFPEKSTGGRKWKITRSVLVWNVPLFTGRGCSEYTFAKSRTARKPRPRSRVYFHIDCKGTSPGNLPDLFSWWMWHWSHTAGWSRASHCPARQDKIQLSCANLVLEELILTVATVKLCFVSHAGLF